MNQIDYIDTLSKERREISKGIPLFFPTIRNVINNEKVNAYDLYLDLTKCNVSPYDIDLILSMSFVKLPYWNWTTPFLGLDDCNKDILLPSTLSKIIIPFIFSDPSIPL